MDIIYIVIKSLLFSIGYFGSIGGTLAFRKGLMKLDKNILSIIGMMIDLVFAQFCILLLLLVVFII